MSASQAATSPTTNTGKAFGTSGYRNYVLFSLTLLYTLNFIDRVLITILSEPIIEEFKITDFQFGLLAGPGFAIMYTLMGIPIARYAETKNRVWIIATGVLLWSVMTALCGFAWGFASLLAIRIGVVIGEAALTPPANSIIADYFPPRGRARAMGTYAMGVTLGGVLAAAFGGPIAEMFSWRTAFIVLGAPGILIALFFLFTVKEPPRGYADPPGTEKAEKLGFAETFSMLSKKPTFWLNTAAASLVAFVGYGVGSLQISYFIRALEMPLTDVALQIAVPAGLAASAGIYIAGYLTEKLSHKIPNAIVIIPGIGLLLSVPLYLIVFSTDSISTAIIALIIAAALHYTYLGAQYTVGQGVASPRARATAIAILLFAVNIIGYAGGPPFVGFLSDLMINAQLAASSFGGQLTPEMCKGGLEALTATIGEAKAQTCISANADGLGRALFYTVMLYAVCGLIYLAAAKTLQKDLVAKLD